MEIQKRLKYLRKKEKITQQEIAEKCGIIKETYRKYELGSRIPNVDSLVKLANAFNVSVLYLIGISDFENLKDLEDNFEKIDIIKKNEVIEFTKKLLQEQQEEKIIYLKEKVNPYEVISESSLSAGYGCGYDDTQETYTVYWDKDINYDYAIAISGESMEPDYHDGDIALIRKRYTYEYDNKVCAVDDIENGKLYIKKIHVNKDDGTVTLESLNKQTYDDGSLMYPDITLENTEKLKLIGLVVDSFTPLEVE